ncbi:hypothetical protein AKJ37_00855 [candidate division MSBL1 archaeon SCGC-AAA259I09]|uniref:DNA repair and recombination protein RadA n=1 Tax=candidate division MSBL1 archaeon SCGC-AAA259I09 TaxID=1698267 RepID=A0A133UVL6_9EURY|nr:hypothetical protein AKJ37_00855 [candidate division MSBL1 archaeon SCGC-AAA259I09]
MELKDVEGIGSSRVQKLKDEGVENVQHLATLHPTEIEKKLDVGAGKADDISNSAKRLVRKYGAKLTSARELTEERKKIVKRIPTGADDLDSAIGGGFETNAVSSIYGPSSTGKTQLVHQLVVNCVTDLGREAIFIETEPQNFRGERIKSMAERHEDKFDEPDEIMSDIQVISSGQVPSVKVLYNAYQTCINYMRENSVGLLTIDSWSAPFRQEFFGREQLSDQGREQRRHFPELQYIADEFNAAVILTHQAYSVPDSGQQYQQIAKTGTDKKPAGGNFPQHSSTLNASVRQRKKDTYEMIVWGSPNLGRIEAEFAVEDEGIVDA